MTNRAPDVGDAPALAGKLLDLVVETLEVLIERHLPGFRIPGTFAGHRVEPDVAADLVYTLGHLADGGVEQIAGASIDDAIATVLARIDGVNTHTFFSYRVAETLARYGSFADNRLISGWDQESRDNLAEACDSSTWIPLLDQGLPRNYVAVLSRCEVGRHELGLVDDAAVDGLVDRARAMLAANPRHFLDDSTHGIGRYDIYAADVWLFTEPLADRLGPLWEEGLATALALVEAVGSPDGTAVGWGRSTGVLSATLTIELAALAIAGGHTDRQGLWLRRADDATDGLGLWFRDGLIAAHQHRSTYEYRGPFRRLQMTLDILGKLAWAAAQLADVDPALEPAGDAEAYPWQDQLIRFDDARPASVWAHRSPGAELVIPFVGATRSDYLPAPHLRGLYEVPVDEGLVCWVPMVNARHRTWTAAGVPSEVVTRADGVSARWDSLVLRGELDPPAEGSGDGDRKRLPASCLASWQVEGRSLRFDVELELEDEPDSVSFLIPEADGRPLTVTVEDDDQGRAHADTIEVDGLKEWRSFWSTIPTVHQVDLDAGGRAHRVSLRVTPKLRIASTAHGHHYHDSLYRPLADRVVPLPPPIGTFANRRVRLDQLDALHLHWPEWFAMDDLDEHLRVIATLAERRIPVVWTAHNLTPHDKRPEVHDPIYQAWADTVDAVIHHSHWGEARMRERYRFPSSTPHVVIPHGHFGDLYGSATERSRPEVEAELGLPPCRWRIGLLGAPRTEKLVQAFLDGFARSSRQDLQVVCWSLGPDDVVPDDPRIAVAERYTEVDADRYALRLASCDLLALPFDPDGEMLATGVAADVVGLGLGALVSEWGYLAEVLGPAGIACGHTPDSIAAALDTLTDGQVEAARAASRARQPEQAWTRAADRTFDLFDQVVLAKAATR